MEMKKIIIIAFAIAFLNGCAQYTSMIGPVYTVYSTGNVAQAGTSLVATYAVKKGTGKTPSQHVLTFARNHKVINEMEENNEIINIPEKNTEVIILAKKDTNKLRLCETTHSDPINEIFFVTLDEMDCLRDPFAFTFQ